MESLSATEMENAQNKHKSQRLLSELLHEQQQPFRLEEFLNDRHHLHKRVESYTGNTSLRKIGKRASAHGGEECVSKEGRPLPRSNGLAGKQSKADAYEPFKHSFSIRLPLADNSTRSCSMSQYKVSSPVRSPLKSPVKTSCVKSPSPSRSAARLMEAAVRILEPGLHRCSRPRSSFSFSPASTHVPTTVRYLLELDHKANQSCKTNKRMRRASRKTQLDLSPYPEEDRVSTTSSRNPHRRTIEISHHDRKDSHIRACSQLLETTTLGECHSKIVEEQGRNEGSNNSRSRISSAETKHSSNAWHKASEALISALRLSSAKNAGGSDNKRGNSLVQYSKIFSFTKKPSKREQQSKSCQGQGYKNTKYSLLKSILRRLAPAKESIKANSNCERNGSGMHPTDNSLVRSLSMEAQGNGQSQLRICDIVRWNSFEESKFHEIYVGQGLCQAKGLGHSTNSFLGEEGCISMENERKSFEDVMRKPCLSSQDEKETQKRKVTSKGSVENWQAFLARRKDVNSDFSSHSSSSAWLESSLDSDSGSTSLDLLSSTARSSNSDSRELKRIDLGPPGEPSFDYISLEINENGKASDFHQSPKCTLNMPSTRSQPCDSVCDWNQGYASSNNSIQQNCRCGSSASITTSVNLTGLAWAADVSSVDVKFSSTEFEEEENESIACMDNMISDRRGECNENDDSKASDTGIFEEVEQLSPVSVLDSPFEEDTSGFEQSLANIHRAKKQLLKKICEYERLAHMDPIVLEERIASWKESSSEHESGSDGDEEEEEEEEPDRIHDMYGDMSCPTSPSRSYEEEEEMEWGGVEAEEYVREVLKCSASHTNSEDLTSATSAWGCHYSSVIEGKQDTETQASAGYSNYLKGEHCKLLFDRVREELQSTGKCNGSSGLIVEPWLRELLVKRICGQMCAWNDVDTSCHMNELVESDLKREGQEWKAFREEQEEIGIKIELAILGVLVEEVLVDLVQL